MNLIGGGSSPFPVLCSKLNKYRHENIQTGNTEETGRGREAVSNYDKSRFCFQQQTQVGPDIILQLRYESDMMINLMEKQNPKSVGIKVTHSICNDVGRNSTILEPC